MWDAFKNTLKLNWHKEPVSPRNLIVEAYFYPFVDRMAQGERHWINPGTKQVEPRPPENEIPTRRGS